LGGPDNITAYALQDNELWLHHLVNLIVQQVLGAGYVFYKHIIVAREATIFLVANVLLLVVGFVKYCERTRALNCSNLKSIRSSLKEQPVNQLLYLQSENCHNSNDESLLQLAHSLFHICKCAMVVSVIEVDTRKAETETTKIIKKYRKNPLLWKVIEMELSLMYDVLYTKAAVIHTSWFGYCIRAFSPVAITTSLLLFYFSGSTYGQNRVDVAITYVLFGGALVMETTSLLSALGSSWVLPFLCTTRCSWLRHVALCSGRWHRLRRTVLTLHRHVEVLTRGFFCRSRRWYGTIGQFNLIDYHAAPVHKMYRWLSKLAKVVGIEWDNFYYSWTIEIPEKVKEQAVNMVSRDDINTMGLLRNKWGEIALEEFHPGLLKNIQQNIHGVDFHESVISWHIATDLVLKIQKTKNSGDTEMVYMIKALSNYLMFLLVTSPDMLPGLPQNWLYQQTCENLDRKFKNLHQGKNDNVILRVFRKLFQRHSSTSSSVLKQTADPVNILLEEFDEVSAIEFNPDVPRLTYAYRIAKQVLEWKNASPEVVLLDLWTDFLLYAANRCNRKSHAKKLNSGGEFTTIVVNDRTHTPNKSKKMRCKPVVDIFLPVIRCPTSNFTQMLL
jgi:hypothetical protein